MCWFSISWLIQIFPKYEYSLEQNKLHGTEMIFTQIVLWWIMCNVTVYLSFHDTKLQYSYVCCSDFTFAMVLWIPIGFYILSCSNRCFYKSNICIRLHNCTNMGQVYGIYTNLLVQHTYISARKSSDMKSFCNQNRITSFVEVS